MNTNKKNNGWILCPSRSFPGKFYYFNVVSGEAAWSLNELEKKHLKKDSAVSKESDKLNCYPEPNSPPVIQDYTQHSATTDVYQKLQPKFNKIIRPCTPHMSNICQALVPNYITNSTPFIPNLMWTPVPLPSQMFVPNIIETKKQMADQVTQTQELESMYIQTCGFSLSDRFNNYYKTNTDSGKFKDIFDSQQINHNDKGINKLQKLSCNYNTSVAFVHKEPIHEMKIKSLLREPMLKNSLNLKDRSDSNTILINQDKKLNVHKTNCDKKKDNTNNIQPTKTQVKVLEKSDLRLLLEARKRQKESREASCIVKLLEGRNTVKNDGKHVTFDLTPQSDLESSIIEYPERKMKSIPETLDIRSLKNLGKLKVNYNYVWFIVTDLNVLLYEFEYIEHFVQEEDTCRLLIPNAVLSKIKTISTFNYNGCHPVLAARNLIRRLEYHPRHITVQESNHEADISVSKEILNCCLNLIEQMQHVVLITSDKNLYAKGKSLDLHCYMLQQIKDAQTQIQPRNTPNKLQPCLYENNLAFEVEENNDKLKINKDFRQINISDVSNFKRTVRNDIRNGISKSKTYPNTNNLKIYIKQNMINLNNSDIDTNIQYSPLNKVKKTYANIQSIDNSSEEYKVASFNMQNNPNANSNGQLYRQLNIQKTINNNNACNKIDERLLNEIHSPTRDISYSTHKVVNQTSDMCDYDNSKELLDVSLYEKLKRFYIKNKVMSDRIALRSDEWMCTFTQIMENLMLDLLMESSSCSMYLCTTLEAADDVGKLFEGEPSVTIAVYGLSALYNLIYPNGKLNTYLNPNDVIRTIGCGKLLVESLKAVIPQSESVIETEKLLDHLLNCMEDPKTDPKPIEFIRTPTVSRFDIDEELFASKHIFKKEQSDILIYLKNHFPQWRTNKEESREKHEDNTKQIKYQSNSQNIVRTIGRHLNLLKINNCNEINFDVTREEKEGRSNKSKDATLNTNKISKEPVNKNKNYIDILQDNDFPFTHKNTFADNIKTDSGPKVIREVGIIKTLEDKLVKPLNMLAQSSEGNSITTDNGNMPYLYFNGETNGIVRYNDVFDEISETFTDTACQTEVNRGFINDEISINNQPLTPDESNNDSGLGNENCSAYTFIKRFLVEFSATLVIVYKFITESVLAMRGTNILEDNKKVMYDRADRAHKHISVIIDMLKKILQRENSAGTVKSFLIKAGVDIAGDKRIARYSQVAKKCLEQARLLQQALKVLLRVINENCDHLSITSGTDSSNICYFNIFE